MSRVLGPPAEVAVRRDSLAGRASRKPPTNSGLPKVWRGRRRQHLTLLILAGLGQAGAAGVSATFFSRALTQSGGGARGLLFGVLVSAALMIGLLRMAERILSERLSQDYVHEIRLGLIRRNLLDGGATSLGVAVARTTNDLTSVKNWLTQGVAPLAVGLPMVIGATVALTLLDPVFAIGLALPVGMLAVIVRGLAPLVYARTRRVRRLRGRLSTQVADTLLSTAAIRSAGGSDRELRRIDAHSTGLVTASIEKARAAGAMRGAAAATSAIAMVMVIWTGILAALPTHAIAGALTIVGFLSTPIHDLAKVVEYRQSYRAARRIIGPAVEQTLGADPAPTAVATRPGEPGSVVVAPLRLGDGTTMPGFTARPGDRVVVDAADSSKTTEVLERFVGLRPVPVGQIVASGTDLSTASSKELRRLVGYAARGMVLVRGSVSRTVRYRSPDTGPDEMARLLAAVGLTGRVAQLPQGADTILVRGGEPFTATERSRLLLARAILDDPPLLVFDHLDADLGRQGRTTMRSLLTDYPGVVILASDDPDQVVTATHIWHHDCFDRVDSPHR